MKRIRESTAVPPFLLLTLGLLVACGTEEQPEAATPQAPVEAPAQTQVPVLDPDDLAGLVEEEVVFNLQWVAGPVNRAPVSWVDTVRVEAVSTSTTPGFDRVVFRFPGTVFPGYAVEWTDEAPVDCASRNAADIPGERWVKVTLRVAATPAAVGRPQRPGHPNLSGLAATCSTEGETVWHLGVQETAQVRVIEMRQPGRLVVDVQHGSGHSH